MVSEDSLSLPKITIVTPSFNQSRYLEATIRSVLLQGYPNLEFILIDGGSIDGSVEVIQKYDAWITYWHSQPDHGQSDAINQGFARATGDILGWLNSDDILAKGALFHLAAAYQPGLYWWTGGASCIHLDSAPSSFDPAKVQSVSRQELLHARLIVDQVATFWTREIWVATGAQIAPLDLAMDYELWLRFAKVSSAIPIQKVLGILRKHEAAKTGTSYGYKAYLEECDQVRQQTYQQQQLNFWQRRLLITFWTRHALARRLGWRSWVGRRPIPYV
ncbi:MAG: glycosyltransferase family 2 protein [Cyanobacteria bacterium J06634_6]